MHNPCGCRPGTEANGWHEYRCEDCRADDLQLWQDAVTALDEFEFTWERVRAAVRERQPSFDEHLNLVANGYDSWRRPIHNVVRSIGDVGMSG